MYPRYQTFMRAPLMLSYRSVDARGLVFFEDLAVGQEFTSPGRTVTEADIVIFAGLSGDYNVLHTDAEHMKSSVFGGRLAHGLLGLAIQHGLLDRGIPPRVDERLVGLKWKFRGPIKIGDTIHVRARIAAKKNGDDPAWGLVTVEREVRNHLGEVVQQGETEHLIGRRPR